MPLTGIRIVVQCKRNLEYSLNQNKIYISFKAKYSKARMTRGKVVGVPLSILVALLSFEYSARKYVYFLLMECLF